MSDSIDVEEHLAAILGAVRPVPAEEVGLAQATGRVLRRTARATQPVPAFTNSAMDGFAVLHDDVAVASQQAPAVLEVVGEVAAGSRTDPQIRAGQACRVMTGAPVPSGADTIVPLEHTVEGLGGTDGVTTVVEAPARRGAFVRAAGDDLGIGDPVLPAGIRVQARQVAALTAAGVTSVVVSRRPELVVVTTGDELVHESRELLRGEVRDLSGPLLVDLAAEAGAEVTELVSVADDEEAVLDVVERVTAAGVDLVVLTGGVSVGAHDVVRSAMSRTRRMHFRRVRMQPGGPQGFGSSPDGPLLLGLPGNPVSTAVSWEVFVRPALLAMQGCTGPSRRRVRARARSRWSSPAGRRQYVPIAIDDTDVGSWTVSPVSVKHSASHLAASFGRAEGFAVVPADTSQVEPGDLLDVMLVP